MTPMQPGDAHAEAGAYDLRGEVIRDRLLLCVRPIYVRAESD
jgi:hypothetical protein